MIDKGVYFNRAIVSLIKLLGKMGDNGNTYRLHLYKSVLFTHSTNTNHWWTPTSLDNEEELLLNNLLQQYASEIVVDLL